MARRFNVLLSVLMVSLSMILSSCDISANAVEVTPQPADNSTADVTNQAPDNFPEGTKLDILQWNHFVHRYDQWFDPFAESWGNEVGVDVTVEHISMTELHETFAASIEAGRGPTLIEFIVGASIFIEDVHDLTDLNLQAQEMFGEQIDTCWANSYLPTTDTFYGYCVGWVPDPGNYNIDLWTKIGMPNGPKTWEELLEGGKQIKDEFGVPVGVGLSNEMDSELANRAAIWSFGGSVQDEQENVVINSPETIEAVEYLAQLYNQSMTAEVFEWNAASNNRGLVAGELSFIVNSVSAYRSLQKVNVEAAKNIGFVEALHGPRGDQHVSAHVLSIYVIPKYVEGDELAAAKEFLLHLTKNYNQAVFNSELYNFPAFKSTVPELYDEDGWLDTDPFESYPADKLKLLVEADAWVTSLGYPGPANPAIAEIYTRNIITTMVQQVAQGEQSAAEAVAAAEVEIEAIFEKWRARGLVGGGPQ